MQLEIAASWHIGKGVGDAWRTGGRGPVCAHMEHSAPARKRSTSDVDVPACPACPARLPELTDPQRLCTHLLLHGIVRSAVLGHFGLEQACTLLRVSGVRGGVLFNIFIHRVTPNHVCHTQPQQPHPATTTTSSSTCLPSNVLTCPPRQHKPQGSLPNPHPTEPPHPQKQRTQSHTRPIGRDGCKAQHWPHP